MITRIHKYIKLIPLIPQIFREKIGHKLIVLWSKRELLPYFLYPVNTKKIKIVLLTGCDSSHFKSQIQMLNSVYKYEKEIKVVFYDLGLLKEQAGFLQEEFPYITYKIFDYSKYPAYFNIKLNAGNYAWKPVIVYEEFEKNKCSILWMDAGNVLTDNLNVVRRIVKINGFYSPSSSGNVEDWTHPITIKNLMTSSKILGRRNLASGFACFSYNDQNSKILCRVWNECAYNLNIIAPAGSSRENHRQDQAVLTVLAHQLKLTRFMPKQYYGFDVHKDID